MIMMIFFRVFILILFLINSISHTIYFAFASWSLDVTAFKINNVSNSSNYSLYPGDKFSLDIQWKNNSWIDIKNMFVNFYFNDNSKFSYDWVNLKWVIDFSNTINPIPIWAYSSFSWFSYEITNTSKPIVLNTKTMFLWKIWSSITVSNDISSYENIINYYFKWKSNLDNTDIIWANYSKTIYVNVKPHITDYYFSKSSIVSNWVDSTNIYVKVKDYNWCNNIDWWLVTVNLSQIWLWNNESLIYESCDSDWKTAIFKKTWITTLSSIWDKTFSYTDFYAKDENNNEINPNDSNTNFDNEDRKTNLVLTVVTPNAPNVNISSISPELVSSNDSSLSFSATQTWSYKIVVNWDWICSSWVVVLDWTTYDWNTMNKNIQNSILNHWLNTIYVCVKNEIWDIGSSNVNITKDITSPSIPDIDLSISPANVTTANSTVNFKCSEDWSYKITMNGFNSWYQSATANTSISVSLPNSNMNIWENTVNIYCKDETWNESNKTRTVNKVALPPSMSWSAISLIDNDSDWEWVDWRDLKVTWSSWLANNTFESYRIYILPENTVFTWTYVWLVADSWATTWTWNSNLTTDSLLNPLSWWNYVVYVAIMWKSWDLWEVWSATWTIVSDIVPHPTVLEAKMTSKTNLQVLYDIDLNTFTWAHSATWFLVDIWWNIFTWKTVSSVFWDRVNIEIDDIWTTSFSWVLNMSTWAVYWLPVEWSYAYWTWGIKIIDNIVPEISFVKNTNSLYNNFYTWSLNFTYTTSENLKSSWYTKIEFTRVWWNASPNKYYYIIDDSKLVSWTHNINVDLSSIWLVSWSYYEARFIATDLNWNISTSNAINIKYDNLWPWVPNILNKWPQKVIWVLTDDFSWFSVNDDNWNWSWVKWYKLRFFQWTSTFYDWKTCTWSYIDYDHTDLNSLTKNITLLNYQNYAWWVFAYDNMNNIWLLSSCDNFYIDTNVPNFSNTSIKDITINNTSYAKSWDSLQIKTTIINTDINHIWLNAGTLWYGSNISCASPWVWITCNYLSNIVTYSIASLTPSLTSSVKQVELKASNTSWINTWTTLASITVDNTNPVVWSISNPNSWWVYGWNNLNINFSWIGDNIWVNYLKFEYSSDNWTNWNLIWTWANTSPYVWNISDRISWNDYKLKITVYDMVWNNSSIETWVFSIDKVTPIMNSPLTSPVSWKIKWWSNYNIIWNTWNITDVWWLKTNPINLYYSINWTDFYNIVSNISNNWTYTWSVPASTNTTTAKIKIEAIDNVWNTSSFIWTSFEVDSTFPNIVIDYAWLWGSTPRTNTYINTSWIDLTSTISDLNLSSWVISYSFFNQSNSKYLSWNTFVNDEVFNQLAILSWSNYNLSTNILSWITINNWNTYKLRLKSTDSVWNTALSNQITYFWDTILPVLSITNSSWSYFSWSINISWTSSDNLSWVSSVKISIKKGNLYWNWTSFVNDEQILATSTTNNYANWNYNFVAPIDENDWQNYEVIAYVYDKSYKINNTNNSSINIILDKTWPFIQDNIFTFNTWIIYSWWVNIWITWNQNNIFTSGASLSSNPISLDFFNWTSWLNIMENISNNWSYNYTLPLIDTNFAKFRLKAKDSLWNESSYMLSNEFIIDSISPFIEKIETRWDGYGDINWIKVFFNETIDINSLNISNIFTVNDNTFSWIYLHSNIWWKTILELSFNQVFTWTSITPNIVYNSWIISDQAWRKMSSWNMNSIDKAEPRIKEVNIYDENTNWKFDKLEVVFSENMSSTTDISSFSINNSIIWLWISSLSVSWKNVNISLSESIDFDTNAWNMTLNFLSNTNYKDLSNNQASSKVDIVINDKSKPILVKKELLDTNLDYLWDKIKLTFSENLTWNISWFTISSWSLSSWNIVWNKIEYVISWVSWTSPDIKVSYNSTSLKDNYNNLLDIFSNISINEKISPQLLTSHTLDQNNNWKIDTIKLTFSEILTWNLNDTSISVSSFNILNKAISWSLVMLSLEEKEIIDTFSTPSVEIISNTSLKDEKNNLVIISNINSIDWVWVVIISSRFDEWDKKIYLNFSENISNYLNISNFYLSWSSASIDSLSFIPWTNTWILTLSNTWITYWLSEISLTWSYDTVYQNKTVFSKISASIIINEVMNSWDVKYIELKNLSSSNIDISWYVIENSLWIWNNYTIISWSISWNWYFVISNNNTYFSWFTADKIASLNISSDLVLKNNSVVIDSFKYISYWDNISIERKNWCGNWLDLNCLYQAVTSNWFVNNTYRWTPFSLNIIDIIKPVVSTSIDDNLLLPLGSFYFNYNYSDNILLDTSSIKLGILKWDWANYIWNYSYATWILSENNASFSFSWLTYWKYKIDFSIKDRSWNEEILSKIIYIDDLSIDISTWSVDLWVLYIWDNNIQDNYLEIQVKTIWAWYNITNSYIESLLWDYDWIIWFGWCIGDTCTDIENFKSKNIISLPKNINTSWSLRTDIYRIRYWAKINTLKEAWIYNINNTLNFWVNY